MQIHGIASLHGAQPISGPHRTQATPAAPPSNAWLGADEVEISPEANLVSQVRDLPEIRAERVAEIRAQIADGAYETDEKLDVALGRLLDEIS
jgi:negative regulator of flagellin synthesis FlgM